jgi:hypothetical protein
MSVKQNPARLLAEGNARGVDVKMSIWLDQASLPWLSGIWDVAEALCWQPAPHTHAECGERIGIAGFGAWGLLLAL